MNTIIENKREKCNDLFKNNSVLEAYIFGSILTDKFSTTSDIDFIINFEEITNPVVLGEKWWSAYYGLKEIFHRDIDIISENTLTNPYFIKEINKTKVKIYG